MRWCNSWRFWFFVRRSRSKVRVSRRSTFAQLWPTLSNCMSSEWHINPAAHSHSDGEQLARNRIQATHRKHVARRPTEYQNRVIFATLILQPQPTQNPSSTLQAYLKCNLDQNRAWNHMDCVSGSKVIAVSKYHYWYFCNACCIMDIDIE